ncbi:hypothetical protein ACGFSI_42595 [Streptomyces virginiae]|uniref:hypothetical protein n=1 Tax=Streptomyces virginiae TaxID=1961 RepID=UPI003711F2C9
MALARALAAEPELLLMDEPFAALDALTRERLQEEVRTLAERLGTTVLFVTHSAEEAVLLGSRVLVMARPGGGGAARKPGSGAGHGRLRTAVLARVRPAARPPDRDHARRRPSRPREEVSASYVGWTPSPLEVNPPP